MVPTRALTITVTEGLYGRFVEMARKQGMTPAVYGKLLFEAAYAARCGMTGDRELDAAVAAIGVERPAAPVEAEAQHLRQRLAAALDAAEKWKVYAAEWEQDAKIETQKRDATIAELRGAIAKFEERQAYDVGVIETQGKTIGELKAKVDQLHEGIAARDALISELEARIAAATMQPVEAMSDTAGAAPALTPDQVKRARTYRGYGMSVADIAKAMKVDAAAVKAAFWRAA